ncbi:VOC family protein [Pseudopedobacter beijingensis]|uniref:VOC family protein n=1 Tax=Pseudopedobacter beijingensis TaxID=1207056 RepID=A0ABW4IJ54_9SPHI
MLKLKKIHHIAIICSDYQKSKHFYTKILGFDIIAETYREHRQSYKLDLSVNGEYAIELFSFPNSPKRLSFPEACGLRHLAFAVQDIYEAVEYLDKQGIQTEEIRTDKLTNKKFVFFNDPDHLPLEIYQI